MSQIVADGGTNNGKLGLKPRESFVIAIPFQAQEGAQGQLNVIALGTGGADLSTLNATVLLDPAMIGLNGPGVTGKAHAGEGFHVEVVGRPVFLVAVWGDDQEQADETIALEMNDLTVGIGVNLGDGAVAGRVGIDQTIGLQAGEPRPVPIPNLLEIL
jgi:hypothetical protein